MTDVTDTSPVINRPRDPSDLRVPPSRKLFDLDIGVVVEMPIRGTDEVFRFNATPSDQIAALLIHSQTIAQLIETGGMSWAEVHTMLQVGGRFYPPTHLAMVTREPLNSAAPNLAKDHAIGYWLAREDAR